MAEPALTWHKGSVLPYASLWHTVLRACALNALRPVDLPRACGGRSTAIDLITDAAHRVDVTAFASELGEAPDVFRWPTLSALPFWLRQAVASPHPRLCFPCLSTGYHTALFSLWPLDCCPIHGTPLVSSCHCGAPFNATLRRAADYGTAGSCLCGRLHFFTRETCRRPTLPASATRALDPVATWLDSCCALAHPPLLDEVLGRHTPGCLNWLAVSTRSLGVQWPSCFHTLARSTLQLQTVYQCSIPERISSCVHARSAPPGPEHPARAFWVDTPEVVVYRAFARHIRRHVAPGSTQIVGEFIASCDPLAIGQRIRSDVRALRAFTDMLWSRAIEPGVELRRWPYRKPPLDVIGTIRPCIRDGWHVQAENASQAQAGWIASHAARVTLGAVWQEAALRAALVARTGIADWSDTDLLVPWPRCVWLARATSVESCLVAWQSTATMDAPRQTRTERREAHVRALIQRRRDWLADHSGACLTCTLDTGWTVSESCAPADFDLRRRRVLGFAGERLWFCTEPLTGASLRDWLAHACKRSQRHRLTPSRRYDPA